MRCENHKCRAFCLHLCNDLEQITVVFHYKEAQMEALFPKKRPYSGRQYTAAWAKINAKIANLVFLLRIGAAPEVESNWYSFVYFIS